MKGFPLHATARSISFGLFPLLSVVADKPQRKGIPVNHGIHGFSRGIHLQTG